MEFLTGYVIEKALSVDNVFVFLVVFNTFAVPPHLYKVPVQASLAVVLALLGGATMWSLMAPAGSSAHPSSGPGRPDPS